MKDPNVKIVGWMRHPAVLMWQGYEDSLKYYTNVMIKEWTARGYKNTMELYENFSTKMPDWFYYKAIQDSHKISLYRKLPHFYDYLMTDHLRANLDMGYIWITKLSEYEKKIVKNGSVNFFKYIKDSFINKT